MKIGRFLDDTCSRAGSINWPVDVYPNIILQSKASWEKSIGFLSDFYKNDALIPTSLQNTLVKT